ncbi:MAG: hypothetical protein EA349_15990 [Halomonadaceae bacterium]|nr:MAG: hypothetical protein EA349_15990 [Halomonadaceae bacterium]
MQRFQEQGFDIVTRSDTATASKLLTALRQGDYQVEKVFKDEPRTYIARIRLGDELYMYKIPRGRYNRRWERFLTLFRNGEAIRHFLSMDTLLGLNFKAPEPVMAAEQRQSGMAVDGLLLYRYAPGVEANQQHAALVTPELLRLHRLGYMRRDAHAKNYLINGEDVVFIDFRLKKPRLLKTLRLQIELSKYLRTMPDGWQYLPEPLRHSLMLRFSAWLSRQLRDTRYLRRRLKASIKKLSNKP